MLTRRENFLRTLRRQPHDRMPAHFVLDNFNYPVPIPEEIISVAEISAFSPVERVVEALKFMGLDVVMRIAPSPVRATGCPTRNETLPNGDTVTIYETPRGELRAINSPKPEVNTGFLVGHPVKDLKDYDLLLSMIENTELSVDEAAIAEGRRYMSVVGDDGITYTTGPSTPIMDLTRMWVGLEEFVTHLMEAPQRVGEVLDVMADYNCRQYELIAKHWPGEVIVYWDDANTSYLSRSMFEQYCLPVWKRYAAICHRYGKILVNHTCGRINAVLDLYARSGSDSIDWLTPYPTGDVAPSDAQRVFGDAVTPQVAVLPSVMRNEPPGRVEEHIHSILEGVDISKNFVMMIPPPNGTPIENARRAVQVLTRDYGVPPNRSAKFGNILD